MSRWGRPPTRDLDSTRMEPGAGILCGDERPVAGLCGASHERPVRKPEAQIRIGAPLGILLTFIWILAPA